MSLPPGFLDELRNRASLSQVAGRKVMWDSRKSNQGKGDMWAPCPFHQEKSASFHVDDRKGFYYCFGCHAKGDVLTFIRETENVGFMEAVEILAREVGMEMPARDPRAQQKADRRSELAEVMEDAVRFFRRSLSTGNGQDAREYLARRGLSDKALDRWEIGFALDGWQGLFDHLTGKGVPEDRIIDAGLARASTKGKRPYDVFRNRIMFPIRDARGRCIAFGGRAMDPNDNAKYLNSPETLLFDKGQSLFNHGPAREAAGKGQPLIVAEGYMDVIALAEAGFTAAVAPLGTAVTEGQLQMMWRMAPEPIIALDGDKAGLNAARRLIDLSLPLLEAGQSLRFAIMPEGQDPDDLIRAKGPGAVQEVLDAAMPMVRLLWQRETEGREYDSPERKAALDKALREKIKTIRDPSIRQHYGEEIKALRQDLFNPRRGGQGGGGGFRARGGFAKAPASARLTTRASMLVAAGDDVGARNIVSIILATLVNAPAISGRFEKSLELLRCDDPDFDGVRRAILKSVQSEHAADREYFLEEVGSHVLERLFSLPHIRAHLAVCPGDDAERCVRAVSEGFAKIEASRGLDIELEEAVEDIEAADEEFVTWRLGQAAEAKNLALKAETKETREVWIADNGLAIDRREREKRDSVFSRIVFKKGSS